MRMKFPREFYIPKGYQERKSPHEGSSAVAYVSLEPKPVAMGFIFDRAKPEFHYSYRSVEDLERRVAEFFDSAKASEAFKAEQLAKRKGERATPHPLKVGDILYSSWGYDQTNVDFYQVTRIVGAHTVELTPIAGKEAPSEGYGDMAGRCVASPNHFTGKPFTKRARHDGSVMIASYANAYPWDGKPRYWSSYA